MAQGRARYQATVAPNGRILRLVEWAPAGLPRPIPPEAPEGLVVLGAGHDILYHLGEDRRLRNLPYLEVLEALQQEVRRTLHRVGHGDLLDEPEAAPLLRRLLADIEATATAFRQAWESGLAAP